MPRPESRSDPRRRCNALNCFTSVVGDQEISHFVPFVPVGPGRWLQRIEGTGLIEVLVVSIPNAPTSFPIHFKGLATSARQQKAAIRNRIASASGANLAARMAGRRINLSARALYPRFLWQDAPVGQGKTVASDEAITTPDPNRVSRASLLQFSSNVAALAKHPRSYVDGKYPPDHNQAADLQMEVTAFLYCHPVVRMGNRMTHNSIGLRDVFGHWMTPLSRPSTLYSAERFSPSSHPPSGETFLDKTEFCRLQTLGENQQGCSLATFTGSLWDASS